jgi:hypothetical protein
MPDFLALRGFERIDVSVGRGKDDQVAAHVWRRIHGVAGGELLQRFARFE